MHQSLSGLLGVHGLLPASQRAMVSSYLTSIDWLNHSSRRYDRSWGVFFESFEEFLTFSWPTITVTDTWTGRAHIVVRLSSIGAFLKMLKTR